MRAAPSRKAAAIRYPDIGEKFALLDDGAKQSGYYHVALAGGQTAWIYSTYVEREPDQPLVGVVTPATGKMAVHYIDVDQGASALLEFSCGAVLIDSGGRGDQASAHLMAYLEAFFARRPDLHRTLATIFVTHTHIDHNSNLKLVAQSFHIGGYVHNGVLTGSGSANAKWMAGYAAAATPAISALGVTEDMVLAAGAGGLTNAVIDPVNCSDGDPQFHVLSGSYAVNPGWPDGEFDNGNNKGIVIRLDYGKSSFLFTGDMEDTALETMVQHYAGTATLDVDVYTVGHHGSYNGTSKELVDAMTPKIAVMEMGHSNIQAQWTAWAYGHPRKQAVDLLVAGVSGERTTPATVLVADAVKSFKPVVMTRAIYGTGWDGDITVDADSSGQLAVEPGK
ncbi:MBL fold metallo-hydrolase [Sphingomonas sp. RT2P30]|uniref:MBL fold metallo-hydrolase n=1 Tax=Parasphingomonas halimpatiens TaxID=3096162 RepID=UPI002FC8B2CA